MGRSATRTRPAAIERSMSSSAVSGPVTAVEDLAGGGGSGRPGCRSSGSGLLPRLGLVPAEAAPRPARRGRSRRCPDRRGDDRGPQLLGPRDVVLIEVRMPGRARAAGRPGRSPMIAPATAAAADPERREQVRDRGRQAQLAAPGDPTRRTSESSRTRVGRASAGRGSRRCHREEGQVGGADHEPSATTEEDHDDRGQSLIGTVWRRRRTARSACSSSRRPDETGASARPSPAPSTKPRSASRKVYRAAPSRST